ncbi:MAG TPA: NAD(P)-binding protein, partial [Saprospiraceae bacterium]|nr:NAD(P)-binding protein [Saprospiraceae bacterium]
MKKAIIVGAGPAGLTAAYELLIKSDIKPIVLEQSGDIGGISKTVNYKGNRIDIGGHRFYSKSQTVMDWWTNIMPVEENHIDSPSHDIDEGNKDDLKMMVRNRVSRIYYLRKFFDYPIQLSKKTLSNLGLVKVFKIGISYSKSQLTPKKEINSLEDFFI